MGHALLEIESETGKIGDKKEAPKEDAPAKEPEAAVAAHEEPSPSKQVHKASTAPPGNRALATPAVRHLAKTHNIDINTVSGTGKNGRVTKVDMEAFIRGDVAPAASAGGAQKKQVSYTPLTAPSEGDM